jgi:hypothetical protein
MTPTAPHPIRVHGSCTLRIRYAPVTLSAGLAAGSAGRDFDFLRRGA